MQARREPRSRESHGLESRWARRRFRHLEVEHALLRVDGLDGVDEDDATAMQEARAEHERGRRAANGVEHAAFDDADPRAPSAHAEALGSGKPVREHVTAPAEHVRPHTENVCGGPEFETSEDAERARPGDRLGPRAGLELAQDRAHVVVHRPLGEE